MVSSDDGVSDVCSKVLPDRDILAFVVYVKYTETFTAYVDNQIHTNIHHTIKYKKGQKSTTWVEKSRVKADVQTSRGGATAQLQQPMQRKETNPLCERRNSGSGCDLMYETSPVPCISVKTKQRHQQKKKHNKLQRRIRLQSEVMVVVCFDCWPWEPQHKCTRRLAYTIL